MKKITFSVFYMLKTNSKSSFRSTVISTLLLLSFLASNAQIKPDASTAVPNASGTGTGPFQPAVDDYTNVPVNYVRVFTPQEPMTDGNSVSASGRTVNEVNVSTQYFDGLGKPN